MGTPPLGRSLRGLDFKSLEEALLVLDAGSFRKAAAALSIQPSAVSRRIRALEDVVGVSIFQRQTHGAQPTTAGLRLLRSMRRIVDDGRLILQAGRLAGEGREGTLCIGVVASIAGGGAREILELFLIEHQGIDFNAVQGAPHDHIADVRALRMDAVFAVGNPTAIGCVVEPLWSEPIMVALPEMHHLASAETVTWSDLNSERFLVCRVDPGPDIQDYIVQHLATLGNRPIVNPRTVGRDALIALVGLREGLTLVTGAEAAVQYPGVVFRPLYGETLPFSVVWSERNDNPLLRRFMSRARRWSAERADRPSSPTAVFERTPDLSP